MKFDEDCLAGARILTKVCAQVGHNDKVYVIAEASTRDVADYIARSAAEEGAASVTQVILERAALHGTEPPLDVAEKMARSDVIFCLTSMSMAHTNARYKATNAGARFLSLPDYSLQLLKSPSLRCDFLALIPISEDLGARLSRSGHVEVTTDLGTQMAFDTVGRQANCCPGVCQTPGAMGSPPDAEVNIAPVEGTAKGILVVDGSIPYPGLGLLKEPITIYIENGAISGIDGDSYDTKKLISVFDMVRRPEARMVAEFGIGLNPLAILSGSMLQDEGCAGTVHFGFGSNATIGGTINIPFHLDMVIKSPTVWLDNRMILKEGSFRDNESMI